MDARLLPVAILALGTLVSFPGAATAGETGSSGQGSGNKTSNARRQQDDVAHPNSYGSFGSGDRDREIPIRTLLRAIPHAFVNAD